MLHLSTYNENGNEAGQGCVPVSAGTCRSLAHKDTVEDEVSQAELHTLCEKSHKNDNRFIMTTKAYQAGFLPHTGKMKTKDAGTLVTKNPAWNSEETFLPEISGDCQGIIGVDGTDVFL